MVDRCVAVKVAVIGAGGVGQVIVRHLARSRLANVRVGDIDPGRLREVAKSSVEELSTSRLDAGNVEQVGRFIRGSSVVINASHPRFNMLVMRQALKRKVHYIDLAGLNPAGIAAQIKQGQRWKKAEILAVLGMGEDPGLSNVMARRAADMLDSVNDVLIRDGETSTSDVYPFVALFAPDVFLEEAISPSHYFEGGEIKTMAPFSGREVYPFPSPIGNVPVYSMDHDEIHTLPKHLPKRPNYVDFKLALTDEAASTIKLLQRLGLLERKPVRIGASKIGPLNLLLSLLPQPSQIAGKIHGNAGILVEVRGQASGRKCVYRLYATMSHEDAYSKYLTNATSYLTGTPTAVCALMVLRGQIQDRGVVVPENLDAASFIEESKRLDINTEIEKLEA
jgi:saccharopine dehydrogenase (NAD+, L-lysine-forming)